MKIGDLVYDKFGGEMVVIVKKKSNTIYDCFSPKAGIIELFKTGLIPQTPNNKLINEYIKHTNLYSRK